MRDQVVATVGLYLGEPRGGASGVEQNNGVNSLPHLL